MLVEVVSVSRLAPRLISLRVQGQDLTRFADAAPTSHIKVFLPVDGQEAPTLPTIAPEGRSWPEGEQRPIVRTYTSRCYDSPDQTLEVQFFLHGVGLASQWAEQAKVGDKFAVGGPGGRFGANLTADRWWIAGDESALPAIAILLESLPSSATATVHVEVVGCEDEIELVSSATVKVSWHYRSPGGWGTALLEAAADARITDGTQVWVACETSAVRRIRRHLLDDEPMPDSSLITRGYWRLGTADHPDHDYGED